VRGHALTLRATRRGHVSSAAAFAAIAAASHLLLSPAFAQPLRIQHTPHARAFADGPYGIEATLPTYVPPERIATADVVVEAADGELRSVPLSLSRNVLFGEIPLSMVRPPRLSYYIRVIDTEGGIATAPSGAPEAGLFVVTVVTEVGPSDAAEEARAGAGPVEILSPLPGQIVPGTLPEIAALFDPPLDEPWEILVTLDGEDAAETAEVTPSSLVLVPRDSLAVGPHRVTISAITPTRTVETSWVFYAKTRTERPPLEEAWSREDLPWTHTELDDQAWSVVGRLEFGWTAVVAETTAVESLDVFLPYDEVNSPTIDLYASGSRGSGSALLTARYNPLYDDRLEWFLSAQNERLELDAGDIFPSLSRTALEWAAGLGGRLAARVGRSTTELVAIRVNEADTLAGFGVYSQFAFGAKESFDWSDRLGASLVYVSVFDREASVPEDQRLAEPLRNHVVAGIVRGRAGTLEGELEVARSTVEGEIEGSGGALRARAGVERDLENRIFVEYVWSEPDYYAAGSLEQEPGERAIELEYAYRAREALKTSGWVRVGRTLDSQSGVDEDELELKAYSRAEHSWTFDRGDARIYAVGRYDRVPYDTHDYNYAYGALGGAWRRSRTRALGSLSWGRSRSLETTDTGTAAADLRHDLIEGRWTVRVAGRWTLGTGDEVDYVRSHYTLETRWDLGTADVEVEYWLIDREDRADPAQSYTEHVLTLTIGQAF
jgi:hypothetical protein